MLTSHNNPEEAWSVPDTLVALDASAALPEWPFSNLCCGFPLLKTVFSCFPSTMAVCQSRAFHHFFPGEDALLILSAYGKNFIAQ